MSSSTDLNIRITAEDQAQGVFGKVSGGIGGLVSGLGKIGLAGMGIGVIKDTLQGLTDGLLADAIESEGIAKATEAVLASTKSAAGMSADAVADLASELSKVAPFEDDAIQSAENLLLTFTSIGKDVFPQATETVLNMSQALGQDLKASSVQLGKALNDPINGATALRRVGVALTDQQLEQIKVFQDSGDILSAQKVILKELETEFGGAAKAAGETLAGKMTILNTKFGNVKETIGGALIPVLTGLMDKAMPLVDAFGDWLPGALDGLAASIKPVQDAVEPIINAFSDLVNSGGDLGVFADDLRESFGIDISGMVGPWREALNGLSEAVNKALSGDIMGAITGLFGMVNSAQTTLVGQLAGWGRAFVEWIAPMIPPLLTQLGEVANQALNWVVSQVPVFIGRIQGWASAFLDWVLPMVHPLLMYLEGLASDVLQWVVDKVPELAEQLAGWAQSMINWAIDAVPPLLVELGNLIADVLDWITVEGPPLAEKFIGEWVPAAIKWVAQTAIDILPKLVELIGAIGGWLINTGAPKLLEAALSLGGAILKGILNGLGDLGGSLRQAISDAWSTLDFWIGPFHFQGGTISFDTSGIKVPGFASGTDYAPGGLAIVGENGPELVNLPRGSQVMSAQQTRNITNNFNMTVHSNASSSSVQRDFRFMQALA